MLFVIKNLKKLVLFLALSLSFQFMAQADESIRKQCTELVVSQAVPPRERPNSINACVGKRKGSGFKAL